MNTFNGGMFLENIEWFDESGQELAHRLPESGSGEIKFGAQLTVRESQAGILFYEGKACDAFGPGLHTLKTGNLPILTKILSLPWRGESPLRAEVYMVNLKYFADLKWGTPDPVAFRDSELGLIRLRAHGMYTMQVVQPVLFINSMVGTMGKYTTEDISAYLKRIIVSRFNDYLGEHLDSLFNLPGKFDVFSKALQEKLSVDFAHFGLRLSKLYITSITPPEEVQKAIDDQSRMNVIHDMDKFVKMKAAMAMEKVASGQGEAGAGIGMGMGLMMPAMFSRGFAGGGGTVEPTAQAQASCSDCRHAIAADANFCPYCGHQQLVLSQCGNCGENLMPHAKFCPKCGKPAGSMPASVICPHCQAQNLPGAMFCNHCGNRVS
ncbi:MAG: SPFH domain-containing protein [Desulfocapsaceae bacterium]|nr:SPFH domain-containing protein [Desulfocapsaceae bacterium]